MRLSPTLSIYIGRNFLGSVFALFGLLLILILIFDTIELIRRSANRPEVDFGLILEMALLHLPHIGQQIAPFAILFGAMLGFWRLACSRELVVSRAAGVSVWQFLFPIVFLSLLLGGIMIAVVNPLSSAMLSRFDNLDSRYLKGRTSLIALSHSGLWLRQSNDVERSVVHAKQVRGAGEQIELQDVSVFVFDDKEQFRRRIEAAKARLFDGYWAFEDARTFVPEQPVQRDNSLRYRTNLTASRIQDSFAPPETLSFWDLPEFIRALDTAGFSATRHRLHFQGLLATPLLFCAMALIAAAYTLRLNLRRGGTLIIMVAGAMTGFFFYFLTDLVYVLGLSNSIPVLLAAWAPSLVAVLFGLAMLFHLEEG